MYKFIKPLAIAATLAVLAGCASGPAQTGGAAKTKLPTSLEERAVKRWDFIIAQHAENAYDLLTPGFRATKTRELYASEMNFRPVRWTSVSVMDKECEDEESCNVRLSMNFTIPVHGGSPTTPGFSVVQEKWIKISGQWYFLPDQLGSSVLKKKD